MTDVSSHMYTIICQYCGNCVEKKCLADVPWYCCSIYCKYFTEEKKVLEKKKRSHSIKYIMQKVLVDTF
jgi:hypothetical protein